MLYERILKARRALQSNMPQESNFEDTYYEDEEKITGRKEEVLVGHNYIDDNSETDNTQENIEDSTEGSSEDNTYSTDNAE